MNAERWAYIKALKPINRWFHVSKTFTPIKNKLGMVIGFKPDIGKTYDVGKNKAKLAERIRSHPAGKYAMRAKRQGAK